MALRSSYGPENVSSNSRSSTLRVERVQLAADIGSRRLVGLGLGQIDQFEQVGDLRLEPAPRGDARAYRRQAPHGVLRGLLVVPEIGLGGLRLERGRLGF